MDNVNIALGSSWVVVQYKGTSERLIGFVTSEANIIYHFDDGSTDWDELYNVLDEIVEVRQITKGGCPLFEAAEVIWCKVDKGIQEIVQNELTHIRNELLTVQNYITALEESLNSVNKKGS